MSRQERLIGRRGNLLVVAEHDEFVRYTHRHERIVNLYLSRLIDDRHVELQIGEALL